jgi:hypothetical protein
MNSRIFLLSVHPGGKNKADEIAARAHTFPGYVEIATFLSYLFVAVYRKSNQSQNSLSPLLTAYDKINM